MQSYIYPYPGDEFVKAIHHRINTVSLYLFSSHELIRPSTQLCRNLITYLDLARPSLTPNIMYSDELRVLLEKILGCDLDATTDAVGIRQTWLQMLKCARRTSRLL